ncbi:extracellular solute-binding protein [Candidatus Bipolaricaulota bacterium]|nr:extracellular solute-binding protein [Candidatus Bipolaricaulota bacterium]
MKKYLVVLLSALLGIGLMASMAMAQDVPTLEIIANGVEGGKNAQEIAYYKEFLVPEFEKKMAEQGQEVNVEVIETGVPDERFKSRIVMDMKAGRGADIIGFDQFWLSEFVEAGLLKPLQYFDSNWDKWEGWDQYYTGIKNMMKFKGNMYGLMKGSDVRMIYYNKQLFREAGIDKWWAWQPDSWQELLDTARKLKEELPDVTPLQLNAGSKMGEATTMQGFYMAHLGTGGRIYDQGLGKWVGKSQDLLDTLELYKTIYVDENLGDADMQVAAKAREKTFEAFQNEEIAMLVEGTWFWTDVIDPDAAWGIRTRDAQIGWAAMPAKNPGEGINGQDFVSISGGTGWVPSPATDHPQLTWELLKFIGSYEGKMAYMDYKPGAVTARKDVAQNSPVTSENFFLGTVGPALAPVSTYRPGLEEYPKVSVEVQLLTEEVVTGTAPKKAMENYSKELAKIVGEDKVANKPLEE